MKINVWNIEWLHNQKDKSDIRIERNLRRSEIAKCILSKTKYDMIALLEAGEKYAPDIEGYKKFYCGREYINEKYKNGILLYFKEEKHKYSINIDMDLLDKIKNSDIASFLPVVISEEKRKIHCIFVWTTLKEGEFYNKNEETGYGYKRLNEIMTDSQYSEIKNFMDGTKEKVIVIGDFNIRTEKEDEWNKFKKLLKEEVGLYWVENKEKTSIYGTNDHCFVSESLKSIVSIKIESREYAGMISDHKRVSLTVQ